MKKTPEKKPVILANEHYEAVVARGEKPKIADVEVEFGLAKNQLKNYRLNQGRLKNAAEKALATGDVVPVPVVPTGASALPEAIVKVVKAVAATAGSSPVSAKRIQEALELEDSVESKEWALKVFDAMIDRDMVAKGVLVRDSEDVKRILAGEAPRRNVISQPAAEARLITVKLENVVVCPLNPRKRIDEASIEEMADSILEHDIVQPPVARPGKYADTYEVVFGQRRLLGKRRAIEKAKAAKQPRPETIQLLVREMDDRTVLEEAWVENLQRVDVGPREEVEGFQAMLDLRDDQGKPLYTVTSLAAKFGKDVSFISRRLRLRNVPEEMWQAYEDGVIGLRQMEFVGKLPTEALRKKAAGMVLRPQYRPEGEPLTVLETAKMLKEQFMVSLRGLPWDQKDATLVPVKTDKKTGERLMGGACSDCPHRTGGDADLKAALSGGGNKSKGIGIDPNSCMLPSCCEAKKEAYWQRSKREASEKGSTVLSPEEAKKVFYSWGSGGVMPHSGWVSLSENPGYTETGHHASEDTMPTWGEMIKKVDPKDLTLARNETTGDVHCLLKRERAIELAEAALGKKGKDSPFANRPGAQGDDDDDDDDEDGEGEGSGSRGPLEWQIKVEMRKRLEEAVNGKLRSDVTLEKTPSDQVFTELILGTLWDDLGYGGGLMALLTARGLPEFDADKGDDDEAARMYLDGVVRPEIERAPLAWAALALLEIYDQFIDLAEPLQSEGLLKALNLDREAILAAPDAEEPAEDAA